MSRPNVIYRNTDCPIAFALTNANRVPISLSTAGRVLVFRLTLQGSGTPALTRSTAVTAEREWIVQSSGTGRFLLPKAVTAALATGRYWSEIVYTTEDDKSYRVSGPIEWTVQDLITGAL